MSTFHCVIMVFMAMLNNLFGANNTIEAVLNASRVEAKAARKAMRAIRTKEVRSLKNKEVHNQRVMRKQAMAHISSAQRQAEAISKANQWMVGKSWQEAINALYSEGKLVSMRSKGVATPAAMHTKKPKATKGTKFLVVKANVRSVSQKDAEYRATHKVVGSKTRTAVTWSLWQKVVRKEVVAMRLWLKEMAANDPRGYKVAA